MQLGVFRHKRLLEDDALFRVEARGQIVRNDFDCILRDGRRVRVVARQRVPVRDEIETFVRRIVLQTNPVFKRTKVMANVQFPRWPHPAYDAFLVCYCHRWLPSPSTVISNETSRRLYLYDSFRGFGRLVRREIYPKFLKSKRDSSLRFAPFGMTD